MIAFAQIPTHLLAGGELYRLVSLEPVAAPCALWRRSSTRISAPKCRSDCRTHRDRLSRTAAPSRLWRAISTLHVATSHVGGPVGKPRTIPTTSHVGGPGNTPVNRGIPRTTHRAVLNTRYDMEYTLSATRHTAGVRLLSPLAKWSGAERLNSLGERLCSKVH